MKMLMMIIATWCKKRGRGGCFWGRGTAPVLDVGSPDHDDDHADDDCDGDNYEDDDDDNDDCDGDDC